jgi:hypothetical protein
MATVWWLVLPPPTRKEATRVRQEGAERHMVRFGLKSASCSRLSIAGTMSGDEIGLDTAQD